MRKDPLRITKLFKFKLPLDRGIQSYCTSDKNTDETLHLNPQKKQVTALEWSAKRPTRVLKPGLSLHLLKVFVTNKINK